MHNQFFCLQFLKLNWLPPDEQHIFACRLEDAEKLRDDITKKIKGYTNGCIAKLAKVA